ncbi:hypothetical protein DC889_23525 [Vibrio parahaemolyticus]|nr:hypothetical protein [Vibrio parahaemolyticus]
MKFNAALRGEQRDATQLKPLCHKHKSSTLNQNCQALGIPLERFVRLKLCVKGFVDDFLPRL